MSEKITIDDQINYLESYANMIKAQHDMLLVQIKMLKAGKDIQENFSQFNNLFNMMNPMASYMSNMPNNPSKDSKK